MKVRELQQKLKDFDEDDDVLVMGCSNNENCPSTFNVVGARNKTILCSRVVTLTLREWQ